jgi:hypothetical protein
MAKVSAPLSQSDKLAITLACLGVAAGIVLFLVEKTPIVVGVLLFCMCALLVYPLIHFLNSRWSRVVGMFVMVISVSLFGWTVFPREKKVALVVSTPTPLEESEPGSLEFQRYELFSDAAKTFKIVRGKLIRLDAHYVNPGRPVHHALLIVSVPVVNLKTNPDSDTTVANLFKRTVRAQLEKSPVEGRTVGHAADFWNTGYSESLYTKGN